MKVCIYALRDPDTGRIRYIGKTTDVRRRYMAHLKDLKGDTYRSRWIAKLAREGKRPTLLELEWVEESSWQQAERMWIAHCRSNGCDLVNSTDGGDGTHNPPPDVREKMGLAFRGKRFTPSHKEKIRKALIGRSYSPDTIAKMGRSQSGNTNCVGRILSDETRAKISAALKGRRNSDELRERKRLASIGRLHTSEAKAKMSEGMRQAWIRRKSTMQNY